ncbi:MAG: hypothetical protein RL442_1586 [Pseudomonadota bacterium]|jgi:hypothetical protein
MNLQELEHWEHVDGCASEANNCLFEARLAVAEKGAQDRANISRAQALGLFVVVKEIAQYCKATDAYSGLLTVFVCAYPSREAAQNKVAQLFKDWDGDNDESYTFIAP